MLEELPNLIVNDFALVIVLGLTYFILSNDPLTPKFSCFVVLIISYIANSLSLSLSNTNFCFPLAGAFVLINGLRVGL